MKQDDAKMFGYLGMAISLFSLVVVWWLAVIGLVFASMSFMSSFRGEEIDNVEMMRMVGVLGILISLIGLIKA